VIASLPSPSTGTLEIGPLNIHAYGLMIALGVVAGVWLMGRRFEEKGIGTRDDVNGMAVWAVIAGVIGSRLYHVATDWSKFSPGHLSDIPKIWQGGLGIPGGLLFGIPVGLYYLKRKGIPVGLAANCGAPAIALAQAVARWGNYWNQELYGRPTGLPWGLEIDDAHRTGPAAKYIGQDLVFQPTFLYESLANLALVGVLLLIDKRFKIRGGHLMAMYIMGYGAIRFFVEGLRIDEAHHVGGFRWNQWVALAAIIGGAIYLLISSRRAEPVEELVPAIEANPDDIEVEDLDPAEVVDLDVVADIEDIEDIEDIDSEVDQADEVDNP
ncbi:MAG: prolipoprotein diacylglyceryl transferase, partial [Ilumatobacteraceae bacterium]